MHSHVQRGNEKSLRRNVGQRGILVVGQHLCVLRCECLNCKISVFGVESFKHTLVFSEKEIVLFSRRFGQSHPFDIALFTRNQTDIIAQKDVVPLFVRVNVYCPGKFFTVGIDRTAQGEENR